MKRYASVLALLLLVSIILVSFPQIGLVKAEDTIYIRADGSVEGTDKIQRDGNVYTFTDNIVNQSIIVEKDDIVVDGAGNTLEGDGKKSAIWLENRRNVTIKNMQITHLGEGIRVMGNCENNAIIGNNITDVGHETSANGIWITLGASDTTISGNNITGNYVGIYVYMSGGTIISENCIAANGHGIWISGSSNHIIRNNITNNNVGVSVDVEDNIIHHNNFVNNTVQAKANEGSSPVNSWDNGAEGNYWSNYNGTDSNGDGIGDTPYIIDENNRDNYPLMELYTIPENPLLLPLPYAPFNLFPEPDSIDIPLDTNISISISRPPSIVNMSISPEVAVKERIDEVIDYNGRYTFILSELLEPNTTYSVTMDFGDKGAPEGFAPTSTKTWNFTTVAEAGTDFPIIEVTLAVSVIVVVFVVLYYSRRKLKL
jgi:parallel beta-helix repeat protein